MVALIELLTTYPATAQETRSIFVQMAQAAPRGLHANVILPTYGGSQGNPPDRTHCLDNRAGRCLSLHQESGTGRNDC